MLYHLPSTYQRPVPSDAKDLELDRAIEYLIAGRIENYGETEAQALKAIVWRGPDAATFGILVEAEVRKTITRRASGLRKRAAEVWGASFPAVAEAAHFARGYR